MEFWVEFHVRLVGQEDAFNGPAPDRQDDLEGKESLQTCIIKYYYPRYSNGSARHRFRYRNPSLVCNEIPNWIALLSNPRSTSGTLRRTGGSALTLVSAYTTTAKTAWIWQISQRGSFQSCEEWQPCARANQDNLHSTTAMSGSGKIAAKPRKKPIAKPKAASLAKDEKTFKSAEFVQDSDDEEEVGGEVSTDNHHALPVKNLAARLSPETKKVRAKPTPSSQKPIRRLATHIPSPVVDESGSDGDAGTSRLLSPDNLKTNGLGIVENNLAAKRLSSVAKPSTKRKSPGVSASDTGSSASGQDDSSSPVTAKRRKGSPLPRRDPGRDLNTTLSTKPSRHPTSSDTDEVGESGSNEDAETDAASESGSETQSHSGSGVASDNRTKYGHFATKDIRDLAKSLQCRSKVSPVTAPIRTTPWLQVHYHLLTCCV